MAVKVVPQFQKLSLAERENVKPQEFDYSAGNKFIGQLIDNRRQGYGIFRWSNGEVYIGEFLNDRREGRGAQQWSDGSSYEGDFHQDRRDGQGVQKWSNGETYEGTFVKDSRHGDGMYRWSDGSSLSGSFVRDAAEGYCSLVRPGVTFDGMYKDNKRFGLGVLSITIGKGKVRTPILSV